jgi:hypothetical protein
MVEAYQPLVPDYETHTERLLVAVQSPEDAPGQLPQEDAQAGE